MPIDKKKIVVNLDGKKYEINLPYGLELKSEQETQCNKEGHFCALYKDSQVCLEPKFTQEGKDFIAFGMEPCRKNKEGKIKIEE
jgi:hypothetical protein